MRKLICFFIPVFIVTSAYAQKGKVQTAWRSLTDYETTVTEGKPDLNYLHKAKEAIDMALQNEDTKNKGKTHAYKCRISYAQFQYDIKQEIKKLEPSIPDKNERLLTAYGNMNLSDFEEASAEVIKIQDLDPKFMGNIQEGLLKGTSNLDDEDLKFAVVAQQIKMESSNVATGKYKVKKYDEAADYFYKTAVMNTVLYKIKDTLDFYNACVSAAKAKNPEKTLEYNNKMINAKLQVAYNYQSILSVYISKGDTASAMELLKKARGLFPEDAGLITEETNIYLARGQQKEALANLKISMDKDPKNTFYYLVVGGIYDNLANPKDKVTGKDLEKPANFDELFKNAESSYLKVIELNPSNTDFLATAYRNLGAMYNNYGGYLENYKIAKITDMAKYQKENEMKSQEYYKKAIPNLEKAVAMLQNDQQTMKALRILYNKTGNPTKAKEMDEKIKAGN